MLFKPAKFAFISSILFSVYTPCYSSELFDGIEIENIQIKINFLPFQNTTEWPEYYATSSEVTGTYELEGKTINQTSSLSLVSEHQKGDWYTLQDNSGVFISFNPTEPSVAVSTNYSFYPSNVEPAFKYQVPAYQIVNGNWENFRLGQEMEIQFSSCDMGLEDSVVKSFLAASLEGPILGDQIIRSRNFVVTDNLKCKSKSIKFDSQGGTALYSDCSVSALWIL